MQIRFLFILFCVIFLTECTKRNTQELTPWGDSIQNDTIDPTSNFTLRDIQASGEMIMLTMSGPNTYFDYHGHGMGTQFLLCEQFAQHIGVLLRVEVCKSTDEMLRKLKNGDADIIAYQMPINKTKDAIACGYRVDSLKTGWLVNVNSQELADSLNNWYRPSFLTSIRREEKLRYTAQSVKRHIYAPMLNIKTGTISRYDHLFMRYAQIARWDWQLLAAQCYQESCFDPNAVSWAGACGLMQIMPSTAKELGLALSKIYDPEENIYAAARYIAKLNSNFKDIRNPYERQLFVLGSYNGGALHIRDAMALASKYKRNPHRWSEVSEFVLKLSLPQYYNDPIVKHGYMRGQETTDYVSRILDRWTQYRGVAHGEVKNIHTSGSGFTHSGDIPHEAKRKNRFKL